VLIAAPVAGLADEDGFPFRLRQEVETEMVYSYAFEAVWEASLQHLGELDKTYREKFNVLSSEIWVDRDSGLLNYFALVKRSTGKYFHVHNLLLKPVDKEKTQVTYYIKEGFYFPFGLFQFSPGTQHHARIEPTGPAVRFKAIEARLREVIK
jgi:hypothetical protein